MVHDPIDAVEFYQACRSRPEKPRAPTCRWSQFARLTLVASVACLLISLAAGPRAAHATPTPHAAATI
jgi:hypothetical protein